ncbi:MAG: hypothetical protein K0M48_11835 [Thiobacillus sp.]|nr:hypothetical protein [Thiobacillus sp.]
MTSQEIEQIKEAVAETIKSQDIGATIRQVAKESLDETLAGAVIVRHPGTPQDKGKTNSDPYRTTIHFLAGAITFCLTLMVGIVNALPAERLAFCSPTYMMLGGVLAWISVAALLATICMAIAQTGKTACWDKNSPDTLGGLLGKLKAWLAAPKGGLLLSLKLVPVFPAALAAGYLVLAGWAMRNNDAIPPDLSNFVAVENTCQKPIGKTIGDRPWFPCG